MCILQSIVTACFAQAAICGWLAPFSIFLRLVTNTALVLHALRITRAPPPMSVDGAVRAAAQHFFQVAKAGFCTTTKWRGDCYIDGSHGVLPLDIDGNSPRGAQRLENSTWDEFAGACLLACEQCPRCRYVSMSLSQRDCSWAYACDLEQLKTLAWFTADTFRTARHVPLPSPPPPPPSPPSPPPLPALAPLPRAAMALGRKTLLTPAQLERGMSLGESSRFQRKLRLGRPVTLAAIGASNTVRGGCQEWQGGKCAQPRYTERDADGSPHGWLLQTLEALNRT